MSLSKVRLASFASETLEELLALVLRVTSSVQRSLGKDTDLPVVDPRDFTGAASPTSFSARGWHAEVLQLLAKRDPMFGRWCQLACPGTRANTVNWNWLSDELPELLVRHADVGDGQDTRTGWNGSAPLSREEEFVRDRNTVLVERLWAASQMVVRLRVLEARFSEQLEREKRETLYHLAYGLSHELNNPLANIATRAGVLAEDESHPERQRLLQVILDNAMRGSEMLGDLMLLARSRQWTDETFDFGTLLDDLIVKARAWAEPRGVQIVTPGSARSTPVVRAHAESESYSGARPSSTAERVAAKVSGDPVALTEALWAVIRNAIEAMPDAAAGNQSMSRREGGSGPPTSQYHEASFGYRIYVWWELHCQSEKSGDERFWQADRIGRARERTTASALNQDRQADWLVLRIDDEGHGLSLDAKKHAFDPFYSGREAGRGLGVGLAKALRIVQLHGGTMSIDNRPTGGCSVQVLMPVESW